MIVLPLGCACGARCAPLQSGCISDGRRSDKMNDVFFLLLAHACTVGSDFWGYFVVADFGFGLLATSDFRFSFPGSPGAGISRRSLGFCHFEGIFAGKHGAMHLH